MNSLFLDTSLSSLAFKLVIDDRQIDFKEEEKNKAAEELIYQIDKTCKENGIKFNSLDEIYLTLGPGSYTGERLSLTFGKIYSILSKKVKIYIINTLKAMIDFQGYELSLIDARNDACYAQLYLDGKEISEIKRLEKEDILKIIDKNNKIKIHASYLSYEKLSSLYNYPISKEYIQEKMFINKNHFDLCKDPINLKPIYLNSK